MPPLASVDTLDSYAERLAAFGIDDPGTLLVGFDGTVLYDVRTGEPLPIGTPTQDSTQDPIRSVNESDLSTRLAEIDGLAATPDSALGQDGHDGQETIGHADPSPAIEPTAGEVTSLTDLGDRLATFGIVAAAVVAIAIEQNGALAAAPSVLTPDDAPAQPPVAIVAGSPASPEIGSDDVLLVGANADGLLFDVRTGEALPFDPTPLVFAETGDITSGSAINSAVLADTAVSEIVSNGPVWQLGTATGAIDMVGFYSDLQAFEVTNSETSPMWALCHDCFY